MHEHTAHLFGNPFCTDDGQFGGVFKQRRKRLAFDRKVECRSKSNGSQHAQFVFGDALVGVANRPNQFPLQIVAAVDVVDVLAGERIVKQTVDGEITPPSVLFSRTEGNVIRMPAIGLIGITTKRGDVDLSCLLAAKHCDHTKRGTNLQGPPPAKDFTNLFRRSVGGDIVVLRLAA